LSFSWPSSFLKLSSSFPLTGPKAFLQHGPQAFFHLVHQQLVIKLSSSFPLTSLKAFLQHGPQAFLHVVHRQLILKLTSSFPLTGPKLSFNNMALKLSFIWSTGS
jgi:hypothetical protein